MTTYTITSYGTNVDNTEWSYFQTGGTGANTIVSGDTVLLGNDLGSSGTPLTALLRISIPTGATFDGQGYKIYIDKTSFNSCFNLTGGTVQNLGIDCSSSTSLTTQNAGYIAYVDNYGDVYNCHVNGNLSDRNGGIFGRISGTVNIERCTWNGTIDNVYSGAIVSHGLNVSDIININECYSNGTINDTQSGGIMGLLFNGVTTITNCYFTGTITGSTGAGITTKYNNRYPSCTITNCYSTSPSNNRIVYSVQHASNVDILYCVADVMSNNTFGTSTGNSTTLTDIQGALGGPAASWNSTYPTNVWEAGSGSDYPMLYQFNTGPWTGYTIYTDNATLTGGYEGGNARGDPHITTLFGRTYDYNTLGFSRYFDNCNADNRLVINCEIRKKVIYNRWRSKRYIRRCSIITPKSYIEIKTGFRGEKVRIIKSNIDPSEDITIEENKLTFNNDAMRHCTKCTFDTADNDNALDHEMDNKYHKILQWERNAIRIKIKLDQEYIIDFENVNADNLQPGKIGFNCMNRSNINSYKGLIVDEKWVPYCILENIECEKDLQIDNIMIK